MTCAEISDKYGPRDYVGTVFQALENTLGMDKYGVDTPLMNVDENWHALYSEKTVPHQIYDGVFFSGL